MGHPFGTHLYNIHTTAVTGLTNLQKGSIGKPDATVEFMININFQNLLDFEMDDSFERFFLNSF